MEKQLKENLLYHVYIKSLWFDWKWKWIERNLKQWNGFFPLVVSIVRDVAVRRTG